MPPFATGFDIGMQPSVAVSSSPHIPIAYTTRGGAVRASSPRACVAGAISRSGMLENGCACTYSASEGR